MTNMLAPFVKIEENVQFYLNNRAYEIKENNIENIYGLKIDIEGHEDKALVPFLLNSKDSLLPKKIVIEKLSKNTDYLGCKMAFEKLNYQLISRSKNNSFYERH